MNSFEETNLLTNSLKYQNPETIDNKLDLRYFGMLTWIKEGVHISKHKCC